MEAAVYSIVVFLTKFKVFGYLMKHCLECLMYLHQNYRVNREVNSAKAVQIKTGYPNLSVVIFIVLTS